MDDGLNLASLKIELARRRCEGLREELRSLRTQDYSSPGSTLLIDFVEKAIDAIRSFLKSEGELAEAGLLDAAELEIRVHRITQLIPYLHLILGYINGSDTSCTPTPLIAQLRRFANSVLPSSEVIVSAVMELNYSIQEVGNNIRSLFQDTPLQVCCESLPPFLFVITIPRVESNYVLLHCILSHELGHGLYSRYQLEGKILQKIKVDQDAVKRIVSEAASSAIEDGKTGIPPLIEVAMRELVTRHIVNTTTRWAHELCSDAFGLLLFGPSFYFAFIHFTLGFLPLDRASSSHPPPRIRLRLMSRMLNDLYPNAIFNSTIQNFISFWASLSAQSVLYRDKLIQIAGDAIATDDVLNCIAQEVISCLMDSETYSPEKYKNDIETFGELLVGLIPPGECGDFGSEKPASITTIMNVGWYVYLSRLQAFSDNLAEGEKTSERRIQIKLQDLLLKAFEISEIRQSWQEVSDAIRLQGN
jgi:hypothetical protein